MHESILLPLRTARSQLRAHWETLLRQAPVCSPLAAPDVLVHLMDWTLDEVFKTLTCPPNRRGKRNQTNARALAPAAFQCRCGMNPLQNYFMCLEIALSRAVEKIYSSKTIFDLDREVLATETKLAVAIVSSRELETFCAVCQHSHTPSNRSTENCPYAAERSSLAST